MKTKKRIKSGIALAIIMVFTLTTILAVPVLAEPLSEGSVGAIIQEPLDFVNGTPGASGDGWTWDADAKTLTLSGLVMNLTQYQQAYTAGITLPAGSIVDVQGDSGIELVGQNQDASRIGIYAAGDLTIKGNKTLALDTEEGAGGIMADGNLRIGEGKNPQKGLQLEAKVTCFAICASGTLSVNGSTLTLDVVDPNGVYPGAYLGGMVVGGKGIDAHSYAVDIRYSRIYAENQDKGSYGIYANNGSLRMKNSYYRHMGDATTSYTGIKTANGSVDIISTDVEMQLWTYTGDGNKPLISAGGDGSTIIISDSLVKGRGDGTGLYANGFIEILNSSDIDLTTGGNALDTGAALHIIGSDVQLISTGAGKSAINAAGAVTINASDVYLSGKGSGANGLYTISPVNISGDSYVDMEGTLSAIQVVTTSETDPVTLDGVYVREGGSPQCVSSEARWIHFYSEKGESATLEDASKQVEIATNSRMIFLEQPEDQVVKYPDGASFEIRVSREDKVASYQWYARDFVGNVFELTGQSATTPELIIPSTRQMDNRMTYFCVVTDTAGNQLVSKEAYLDASNKAENKTVLYVGNYAIEPGESLNLAKDTKPVIGMGTVSLSSDGTTITMKNVDMSNDQSMYDVRLSPAMCMRLDRSQSTDESTDVVYTVILDGTNKLKNSFKGDSGNGITLDFELRGKETGKAPTVIIDGESKGGTLSVKGGSEAIRAIADLQVNADITVQPLYAGDTSYIDGVVADTSGTSTHDMSIGANHKLNLTTYGAGLLSTGSLSVGENTEINIDMTMPSLVTDSSAGTALAEKGAIKVGRDKLELKANSKLNISGVIDPDIMSNVGACYGLWLDGAGLLADQSSISIDMLAKPYEDPEYAGGLYGISSKSYIKMTNSSLDVSVDADHWTHTAYGVLAQSNVSMDHCTAIITAAADSEAYGLAANKELTLTASQIEVGTQYVGNTDSGCSYGILGGSYVDLDVMSEPGSYIKADTMNANGIAFIAATGETGDTPKSYDPSYQAKMYKGDFEVVQPQSSAISIASIPGGQHPYVYLESFYDLADTSKPASSVLLAKTIPIDKAQVKLAYTKTTYNGKAKEPGVTVKLDGKTLVNGVDYTVEYANNIKAGTATVTVRGAGVHTGSVKANFKILKAKNKAKKVTPATQKLKAKKLAKEKASYKLKATLTAKAKVTWKVAKYVGKAKNYISVAKNGKVKVRKGTPAGTYKVKVYVIAAATKNYAKTVTKKTIKVVVN